MASSMAHQRNSAARGDSPGRFVFSKHPRMGRTDLAYFTWTFCFVVSAAL